MGVGNETMCWLRRRGSEVAAHYLCVDQEPYSRTEEKLDGLPLSQLSCGSQSPRSEVIEYLHMFEWLRAVDELKFLAVHAFRETLYQHWKRRSVDVPRVAVAHICQYKDSPFAGLYLFPNLLDS
jgi:hypothetical protein